MNILEDHSKDLILDRIYPSSSQINKLNLLTNRVPSKVLSNIFLNFLFILFKKYSLILQEIKKGKYITTLNSMTLSQDCMIYLMK